MEDVIEKSHPDQDRRPQELRQLQAWMLQAVTGIELPGASPTAPVETVILPSLLQSSEERLNVYRRAYWARLIQCMGELFPATKCAVGEEVFTQFAAGFLRAYPSKSYTLNDLGRDFPAFLSASQPKGEFAFDEGAFLCELAELELNLEEVFDGPGLENEELEITEAHRDEERNRLQGLAPEVFASSMWQAAPCLRLKSFGFPINEVYECFRRHGVFDWPQPQRSYVAIMRRDFRIRRIPLEALEFELLAKITSGKWSLNEALNDVLTTSGNMPTGEQLRSWFEKWTSEKIVRLLSR